MKKVTLVFAAILGVLFSGQIFSQEVKQASSSSLPFNSTYLGGAGAEHISAPVVDKEGKIYITGMATAPIPGVPVDGYDVSHNGGNDGFVAKFSPDLSRLLAFTYFGGSGDERSFDLALSSSGDVYIIGVCTSDDLPITEGAFDNSWAGGEDVFIACFDKDLKNLKACTLTGGSSDEGYCNIAISAEGDVIAEFSTSAEDFTLPPGYRASGRGRGNIVVVKFDAALSSASGSAVIGGSSQEYAFEIAINSKGVIYIVGDSSSSDFPVSAESYKQNNSGGTDVFIAALSPDLKELKHSTLAGGTNNDMGGYLVFDSKDNVYIAGESGSRNLPATPGAYNTASNGSYDLHIAKFDSSLSSLIACSYLGGAGVENCHGMAVDRHDNLYLAGYTLSQNFPTTPGSYDRNYNGGEMDMFIVKMKNDLSSVLAATYLGGNRQDYYGSIGLDLDDNPVITGRIDSTDYPVSPDAFQRNNNGGEYELVITKLPRDLSLTQINESADLKISGLKINRKKLTPGGKYKFKLSVENLALDLDSYPCKASFYINSRAKLNSKSVLLGTIDIKSISPGGEIKNKFIAVLPEDFNYRKNTWLLIEIDQENINYDPDRENNVGKYKLLVE